MNRNEMLVQDNRKGSVQVNEMKDSAMNTNMMICPGYQISTHPAKTAYSRSGPGDGESK
jgi:hypothetical protein